MGSTSVTFSADGTPIKGCSDLYLNPGEDWNTGNYPATCKTADLIEGHEITGAFTDWMVLNNDTILNLQKVVKLPDTTPPVVSVVGVAEGAVYPRGSMPSAECSTTDAESGVATHASLTLSGGDAQGLGSFTATCSGALDHAGNTAEPVSAHDSIIAASFDSVSAPAGWTCNYSNGKVTCASDSLAGGSSAVIKLTVVVNKNVEVGKELVNHAWVASTTYDLDTLNDHAVQKTTVSKVEIFLPLVISGGFAWGEGEGCMIWRAPTHFE